MSWLGQVKQRKRAQEEAKESPSKRVKTEVKVEPAFETEVTVAASGPFSLNHTELTAHKFDLRSRMATAVTLPGQNMVAVGTDRGGTINIIKFTKSRQRKALHQQTYAGGFKKKITSFACYYDDEEDQFKYLGLGKTNVLTLDAEAKEITELRSFIGFSVSGLNGIESLVGATNMMSGENRQKVAAIADNGKIYVINGRTKNVEVSLRLNAPCTCAVFHPTEPWIIAGDSKGKVYVWDITTGKCIGKYSSTLINISQVAISVTNHVAIGSPSGFVHIVSLNKEGAFIQTSSQPIKEFGNIRFESNLLSFDPTGAYLVIGSSTTTNQLRVVRMKDLAVAVDFPKTTADRSLEQFNEIKSICWRQVEAESREDPLLIVCETNGRTKLFTIHD